MVSGEIHGPETYTSIGSGDIHGPGKLDRCRTGPILPLARVRFVSLGYAILLPDRTSDFRVRF